MTTNWQDPPGTTPPGNNKWQPKRFAVVAGLLIVIAGLAAAAGLVMVNRGGDDKTDSADYVVVDTPNVTPVFEPRDARGNDPFFPLEVQLATFQADTVAESLRTAQAAAQPGDTVEIEEFDVAALDASVQTGLYGGTEENTCDPERMISFLYANPDLAEAWAKVQEIEVSEIATYIRALEPRVLAEPVNVLNHGYNATSGAAYEIDAVLDAGTAVLVDKNGDVRTRCYCGNPLKPKPPTNHMPPRCLVFGAYVFVLPGGGEKRVGAPRDVLLTGNETTVGGALWIEVKWGNGDTEKGWTRSDNLRKWYCPPPTSDRYCPGPGVVPVWEGPNMNNQVGRVTGVVRLHNQDVDIFAPISPVGGIGGETIINDFMLIRFKQVAPSVQNSAWVKLSDLNQDDDECFRIRQCIDTNGPVQKRAGGANIPGSDGVQWVEFTGHFAAKPVTHTEIRLNNGTGNYGWISQLYIPLAPERCEPPVMDCIEGDVLVYETSDNSVPLHFGHLNNAEVEVIGGPQDGRIQIRMAPGGPDGWVDQIWFFDGKDDCRPVLQCYITTGPAWTEFPTNGANIGPIGTPTILEHRGKIVDGAPIYVRIGVAGVGYWIDMNDLIPLDPARCEPEVPDCPTEPGIPLDRFLETRILVERLDPATENPPGDGPDDGLTRTVCCVSALFNTPNVGDPAAVPLPAPVLVVSQIVVGGETWFITSDGLFFRTVDIVNVERCRMPECPQPMRYPGPDDEEIRELLASEGGTVRLVERDATARVVIERIPGGDCCVSALYTAPNFGAPQPLTPLPAFVDIVGGPVLNAPAWFLTSDGFWFPETAVVADSECVPIECPTPPGTPGDLDTPGIKLLSEIEVDSPMSIFFGGNTAGCCVSGDFHTAPGGDAAGSLAGPTPVLVIGVSDDGQWYQVIIDDFIAWVHVSSFVDFGECEPGACPNPESQVGLDNQGRTICCASIGAAGVPQSFEEVTLTGETRDAGGGVLEYNTVDHGWILETQFADGELCADNAVCPRVSVISPNDPSTCCVALGNGQFDEVELTGETRDAGGGVLEYNTVDHGWILETDFVGGERCVPCPPGTQRNTDGGCTELVVPATPQPTPRPTPRPTPTTGPTPCANIDNDGWCDVGDNCRFTPNDDQADFDGDGVGDACDNCPETPNPDQADDDEDGIGDACEIACPDRDQDGVCDSDDNCISVANPGQADADEDGVGNRCDNCPSTFNPDQADSNENGEGDACEVTCPDRDQDGVCDSEDNCISVPNPDQEDKDGDGVGDACDDCPFGDTDGDGSCDNEDNCVNVYNPGQSDTDQDGVGNECDRCPDEYTPGNVWPWDSDGDGINDRCTPIIN